MAANGLEIYQPDAQVGELKLWRPPAQVLMEAQQAAAELQRIIEANPKKVMFNGEQYLEFEDWETLAHFYGYCPKVESTQHVEFGDVQGFKACAVLISEHTGLVVSRAESMCLNDEENWGPRPKYEWKKILGPDNKPIFNQATGKYKVEKVQVGTVPTPLFQLLSMAQTRACAKVCRNKLGWVARVAGYKPTPAEEMDETVPELEPALPTEIKRKNPQPVPRAAEALAVRATPAAAAPPPPPQVAPRPEPVRPLQPASSAMPHPGPARPVPPPTRSPAVKVISEAQARRFYAIRKGTGWSDQEVKDYLREVFGIEDDRLIPANRYEEATRWAEGKDI